MHANNHKSVSGTIATGDDRPWRTRQAGSGSVLASWAQLNRSALESGKKENRASQKRALGGGVELGARTQAQCCGSARRGMSRSRRCRPSCGIGGDLGRSAMTGRRDGSDAGAGGATRAGRSARLGRRVEVCPARADPPRAPADSTGGSDADRDGPSRTLLSRTLPLRRSEVINGLLQNRKAVDPAGR